MCGKCPIGKIESIENKAKSMEVKIETVIEKMGIIAVTLAEESSVKELSNFCKQSGCEMEEDPKRYPISIRSSPSSNARKLESSETTPWGITRIYERDGVPPLSYFNDPEEKKVCVLDSGYVNHEDLPAEMCASPGGCEDSSDCAWHGTHVSGSIGAIGGNNVGVVGVNPNLSSITIAKAFSESNCAFTYASGIIGAVQDCLDNGAEVVNMSLGGTLSSSVEAAAFEEFFNEKGMINVAASGNSGPYKVNYPAAYSSVISVGAVDLDDVIASYSTTNSQVDISAPGSDILSTIGPGPDTYGYKNGTSMACPHVAGVALTLWNKFPECANFEIRDALESGADDLGPPGRDDEYGHGRLNYYKSYDILAAGCSGTRSPTLSPTPADSSPEECSYFSSTIKIMTDDFPYHTSVRLKTVDADEVILYEFELFEANSLYEYEQCLLPGTCYKFKIYDAFGDGICCSEGDGYYNVTLDGVEVASGGNFGSSESTTFCTETCSDSSLPIPFGGKKYFCEDVVSFCTDPDDGSLFSSHCPVTCGACAEYGCKDSEVTWVYDSREYTCADIGQFPRRKRKYCKTDEAKETCPDTCDVCTKGKNIFLH